MSTWVVVLIVVVIAVVAIAVVAGVRRNHRQKKASTAMGLPPIGALSGEEPVVGSGSSVPGTPVDEQVEQPRRH